MDRELRRAEREGRTSRHHLLRAGLLDPVQELLDKLLGRCEFVQELTRRRERDEIAAATTTTVEWVFERGFQPFLEAQRVGYRCVINDRDYYGPAFDAERYHEGRWRASFTSKHIAARHEVAETLCRDYDDDVQRLFIATAWWARNTRTLTVHIPNALWDDLMFYGMPVGWVTQADALGVPLADIWRGRTK